MFSDDTPKPKNLLAAAAASMVLKRLPVVGMAKSGGVLVRLGQALLRLRKNQDGAIELAATTEFHPLCVHNNMGEVEQLAFHLDGYSLEVFPIEQRLIVRGFEFAGVPAGVMIDLPEARITQLWLDKHHDGVVRPENIVHLA